MKADKLNAARLSHALRTSTRKESEWPLVTSANLDQLLAAPLPGVRSQTKLLLTWVANSLGEDFLGSVPLPNLNHLAGFVGAVDGSRVGNLIGQVKKQGYLDGTLDSLSLTPDGWEQISSEHKQEQTEMASPKKEEPDVIKCHCENCGGDRNSIIRGKFKVTGSDDVISWQDTYSIVQCQGCEGVSFRHELWFSEWDDYDYDPVTGETIMIPGIKVTTWPPPSSHDAPEWLYSLSDDVLRSIFEEVYSSLNSGNLILAMIGTRTLLDWTMAHAVGDVSGGFEGKVKAMIKAGKLGADEKDTVLTLTDVGSASAHRGFKPKMETVETVLSAIEAMVYREYILPAAAAEVKKVTPPRFPKTK
ncbi:DUF4145 domain-containing protein [Pseudodesulfovibrio karagichevae]|uniref:DUF4145 domain-containing protein n=1 Tax=Pseudodesulfovibrio karagichevae TaxID=3239305 RepID=A0ABV4JXD4_9BACT